MLPPTSTASEPPPEYSVQWAEEALQHVRERVLDYRFPPVPADPGWRFGCDPAFLRSVCRHWVGDFDIAATQAQLNRFPQFRYRVEGMDLHVVHVVGEAEGRRPLMLIHGWPSSTYEFWPVVEALAFPSRFGGHPKDAVDVVLPTLPGFGPSGRPRAPIGIRTTARLFNTLMRDNLGYERYLVHGADWGAGVASWLGIEHAESLGGLHLSSLLVHPDAEPESDEERAYGDARRARSDALGGYELLQRTRPLSLGYAMVDQPVAQAAWIIERLHDWSDRRHRHFKEIFSLDQLLTTVMIYVMNDALSTSMWFYAAGPAEHAYVIPRGRRVVVPTAITTYPDPRMPFAPRRWVERGYEVVRWVDQPAGGHFAAAEVPEAFVADLQGWIQAARPW